MRQFKKIPLTERFAIPKISFLHLHVRVLFLPLLILSIIFTACGTGEGDGEGNNRGSHYTGANCIASGCHLNGEKIFTVAGTVYQSDMVTPRAGAIIVINKGTYSRSLTTDASGNFYAYDVILASGSMTSAYVQDTGIPMNSATNFPSGCNGCHGVSTARIY